MSRETEILTNLELLEVFLKTQGSAPSTRGAVLCDNASKQLLLRINQKSSSAEATTPENPSQDHVSCSSPASSSDGMESSLGFRQPSSPVQSLSAEESKTQYMMAVETLRQQSVTNIDSLKILARYVLPGKSISATDLPGLLDKIRDAEVILFSHTHNMDLLLNDKTVHFVRGFVATEYPEYVI